MSQVSKNNLAISPAILYKIFILQFFLIMVDILVDKTAAANSNLGIDVYLIGAHNLAITKLQWIFPIAFISLTYTTCLYPFSEASEKLCKLLLTTWPNPSRL